MTLMKTNKRSHHEILAGIFSLAILLQSTKLIAASDEAEIDGALPAAGAIVPIPPTMPAMVVGHKAAYQRFMESSLEYRPIKGSDAGLIIIPFRDLLAPLARTANPFSATFDLSRCGDAWKYISINIGYKKSRIRANDNKVEVWICPRFLPEKERPSSLVPIMGQWEATVGYFWTWGGHDVHTDNYDYLLNGSLIDKDKNLFEKWSRARCNCVHGSIVVPVSVIVPHLESFIVR